VLSDPRPDVLGQELPALVARGHRSLKVYMTYEAMRLSDTQILDVLEVAREQRAIVLVHAENHEIIGWLADHLERCGDTAPRFHATSRPIAVEREATHRALTLGEIAGVPLVIVHVSGAEPLEEIRRARARGLTVIAETCPQYLTLTADDLDQPDMLGAKVMCSPPPRDTASQAACWRGIEDGTFELFNSDHAPYRFDSEGKLRAGPAAPFRKVSNGVPGLATRLPILFSEGVIGGRISLPRFVALTASNNAAIYGLDRKGRIAIGADADIVLWDPERKVRITNDLLHHEVDYTPWEGMMVTGWPELVLSRGDIVVERGELRASPGRGRFIEQSVSAAFGPKPAWI
jgi:dihydropyrimidinase